MLSVWVLNILFQVGYLFYNSLLEKICSLNQFLVQLPNLYWYFFLFDPIIHILFIYCIVRNFLYNTLGCLYKRLYIRPLSIYEIFFYNTFNFLKPEDQLLWELTWLLDLFQQSGTKILHKFDIIILLGYCSQAWI